LEFTDKDRKMYQLLIREPLSLWIVIPGYLIIYCLHAAAVHYLDWTWLADIKVDLPLLILLIFILGRSPISNAQREFLTRFSSLHSELNESPKTEAKVT
jgi:hypothetical protein